jgi:sugar lactone lactonase YvrE
VLLASASSCVHAQAYFSGVTTTISPVPPAVSAFTSPYEISLDSHGNLYVADFDDGQVLKMAADGNGGFGTPTQVQTAQTFTAPGDVVADAGGDLFVADYGGQVWEIPAGSTSSTPAIAVGTGWSAPSGLVLDSQGQYLFVSDAGAGTVTRIQLSDGTTQGVNHFSSPAGLALDSSGNLYVVETGTAYNDNGDVKEIPLAVSSSSANFQSTPSPVGTISFNYPIGISIDASGNLWIAEALGPAIREMLASDNYTTVKTWGSGLFAQPIGIAWNPNGNVIVSDSSEAAIKQIATAGVNFGLSAIGAKSSSSPITLQFGFLSSETGVVPSVVTQGATATDFSIDATTPGTCQSNGTSQTYSSGNSCTVIVDFDPSLSGARYGAVQLSGAAASVYGTGTGPQITYNLSPNFVPGTTKAPLAGPFSNPSGLAVDGSGNVYVADQLDGTVQKVSGGSAASIGTGFTNPVSVALDGAGDVFVADSGADKVFEIVAGSGTTNQLASAYGFSNPRAVAVDANGNVYVADGGTSHSIVEILAGSQYSVANVLSSGFTAPDGIAVDGAGNLYVADSSTNTVYELAAGGTTPTAIANSFSSPAQVAIDGNGNLFVADSGNGAVKEILAGTTTPFALDSTATFTGPLGVTVDGPGNVYVANSGANLVQELDYADAPGLTFGPQEDGTESAAQSVQIVNDGNTTALTYVSPGLSLGTSNYALQGGGSDCSSTFSLNPNASCNVTVEFTPGTGVTGTVTDAVTLTDNNLNGNPATQTIGLSGTAVNLQITLPASTTLPGGTVGVAYGPVTFSAGGGTGTGYTWAATGLPAGLSLDSTTGALSGTPTAVASAVTVTVTATDSGSGSSGVQVQKSYTLTVVAGTVTVNWIPPSSITYGTTLATVLTATATEGASTVPGTFAYTAKLNPGGAANTVTAATVLTAGTYTLTATFTPADTTDYSTPAPVNGTLTITQATPLITWATPAPITYGTPLSATQLDATSTVAGNFVYTPIAGTVLSVGAGQTLSVTLNPTDATDYASATATVTINVVGAAPTITFQVSNQTYGNGPFAVTATSNSAGAFAYSVVSGPAMIAGNTVTLTGAGSVTLQASETAAGNYTAGAAQTTIVVAKQASQTTVTTNSPSIGPGQSATLTATVTPAVLGSPGGTVTFFNGTTPLGSPVTLTSGTAQLVVSNLASGANSISAMYSGDTNFLTSSGSLSGGITVASLGFTMSASPASQTGVPGTAFAYNVTVTPTYGTFPGTVSFAASGLPPGATASFTPSTVAATAGQTTIGVAIVTTSKTSSLKTLPVGGRLAPVAFALLLLPLAGTRRMRRQGQRFGRFLCLLLLALAGVVATTALTGCGASVFHPTTPLTYTITITATSGAVQQTATVNINLQ